ncbi:hypothetical protein QTJ01_04700 [Clostridium perfringens]|nr:hypothetical protein [Clostridium perfringens]MDM0991331.1 hypothetical protein [Clostridium perfringens]
MMKERFELLQLKELREITTLSTLKKNDLEYIMVNVLGYEGEKLTRLEMISKIKESKRYLLLREFELEVALIGTRDRIIDLALDVLANGECYRKFVEYKLNSIGINLNEEEPRFENLEPINIEVTLKRGFELSPYDDDNLPF